ncbi:MAG TPA: TIM barrel protein [Steroidobacteraceae bacterium]|jgi:sugar phosphate isomerase/epimerase
MRLSLHQLTVPDISPPELVDIAARLECDHVCFLIGVPGNPGPFRRINTVSEARELKQRIEAAGMSACNTGTFMAHPDVELSSYRETLNIAAALGASSVNSLIQHPDRIRTAEKLRDFAQLAKTYGLAVVLEWYRFSEVTTLKEAVEFLKLAGSDNIALNADILHLIRNGEGPSDMAKVDPALLKYAQICDGPLTLPEDKQVEEATANRDFPGAGEFPLVSFIRQLPKSGTVSVEAPVNRMSVKLSAAERAKGAIDGARKVIAAAKTGTSSA